MFLKAFAEPLNNYYICFLIICALTSMQVNITIDNVVIFVANLSEVVSDAVGISDQNEDNVIVISFLLTQTSNLLQQSSSTLSLEMIKLVNEVLD